MAMATAISMRKILITPWIDGVDNDGNGRIDDLVGWNFLERNNKPMDTNGHGTHVAGITERGGTTDRHRGSELACPIASLEESEWRRSSRCRSDQAIEYALSRGVKVNQLELGNIREQPRTGGRDCVGGEGRCRRDRSR